MLTRDRRSRGIYLKHFNGSLKTAKGGLIRFSKEDIVYISKFHCYIYGILAPANHI
jgi:hypothetical protein